MSRLTARQRFILTAALVATASSGAIAVFFLASQTVRSSRAALQAIETNIHFLEQEHASGMQIAQALGRRTRDVERLKKFFVNPERPLDFIEKIEDVARRTGNGISLALDQSRAEPKTLFLRLALEGGDSNIASMLSLIDTLPYDIEVRQMNYETLGERSGQIPIAQGAKASARMTLVIGVKTR